MPLNNTTTARKVQWFIPPYNLGSVTSGNNITTVYFQSGSTVIKTYPILTVKLKTGSGTGLTGTVSGPVEPGMTVVYSGINVTINATAGQWFAINLTTPWLYDPSQPLIVELEHNSTSGTGPTVYQPVSIPGPGNGRQWADYNTNVITSMGTERVNFGIDVIPATPCTGVPPANTLFPSTFTACPGFANPSLSLTATYSLGGLNYAWQSSTVSPVGPFNTIPGATLNTAPIPTLGITTWYQALVTCTNPGGGTQTVTSSQYYVGGTITNTVPYVEDFEGIQMNDRLPNCSWWTTNLGSSVNTYTTGASNNRLPHSGSRFASFGLPSNNNYVYTNGIQMEPGITYSAGLWYSTEYFGYNNWTDLSLFVGNSQTSTGLNLIANTSPAITGPYKPLGGTFTVPTSGIYYIAVRANASSGSALYLSWDDLSVTIPCTPASGNSPTVSLSAGATTICAGDQVSLNANGADGYMWSNGATTGGIVVAPVNTTTYTVVGTNSVTGCSAALSQVITVNPSPNVFCVADKDAICKEESTYISAYNGISYAWSNGATGNLATVSPNATTTYSVIGTNAQGCSKTASVQITIKPQPTITAISSNPGESCAGEVLTYNATGAATYRWYRNTSSVLLAGNPINVPLYTTTTFTVVGTGQNGCAGEFILNQSVNPCTGIEKLQANIEGLNVFPNPASNKLNIELASGIINSVELIDVDGRVVLSADGGKSSLDLDISHLSSGIYFAKITSDDVTNIVRVVKH